jgi:Fe2+ transport system protein FeoA
MRFLPWPDQQPAKKDTCDEVFNTGPNLRQKLMGRQTDIRLNILLETQSQYQYRDVVNGEASSKEGPGIPCPQPGICALDQVQAGTSVRIKHLAATPELNHRLRELGFCEEQRVKLLLKHTNVVCQVCNVRLGISAQLARSIMVEPIKTSPTQNQKKAA